MACKTLEDKIRSLLTLREEILAEAGATRCRFEECPLNQERFVGHRALTKFLVGVGCWEWDCPFCGREESDL